MTIAVVKKHLPKFVYGSLGALLMSAFTLGTIWKEHGNMMQDVEILKTHDEFSREKQTQLTMSDSLLSIRLNDLVKSQNEIRREQILTRKVVNKIANKLHVELPAE